MALLEPVVASAGAPFALVDAESPAPNDADGIRATVTRCADTMAAGDRSAAAEVFIDYWMGAGA